jgi:hypothetical protein
MKTLPGAYPVVVKSQFAALQQNPELFPFHPILSL